MSNSLEIFFDSSIPIFVRAIAASLGADGLKRGLIVRDTSGRLRFLSVNPSPADEVRSELEKNLGHALGGYARKDGVIAFGDELGVRRLLKDPAILPKREEPFSITQMVPRSFTRRARINSGPICNAMSPRSVSK